MKGPIGNCRVVSHSRLLWSKRRHENNPISMNTAAELVDLWPGIILADNWKRFKRAFRGNWNARRSKNEGSDRSKLPLCYECGQKGTSEKNVHPKHSTRADKHGRYQRRFTIDEVAVTWATMTLKTEVLVVSSLSWKENSQGKNRKGNIRNWSWVAGCSCPIRHKGRYQNSSYKQDSATKLVGLRSWNILNDYRRSKWPTKGNRTSREKEIKCDSGRKTTDVFRVWTEGAH